MTSRSACAVAGLLLALAVGATELVLGERNGAAFDVRTGHVVAWSLRGGVMTLEYLTDRIFGDDFE